MLSTPANALNLKEYSNGMDQAAHAKLEAVFLFDQVQKQSGHIQDAAQNAPTVQDRIELINTASNYAGWMWFHYGQMATAYPSDKREAFSRYIACSEAAYSLQQVGYTIIRILKNTGKTTNQDLHEAIELHQKELLTCSEALGLEIR